MYNEFFELNHSPFELTPDPFFLFSSEKSKEALESISFAISQRKGFVVMTGEVGTGKTLILRCLFELWEREKLPFAYFIGPRLSTIDFLSYIAFELGIKVEKPSKGTLLRALYGYLLAQYEKGLTTVLVIDEAHQITRNVLEEIRLLTNFETAQHKLIQLVLVGQPELDEKLDSVELRSLKQRIAVRCQLLPLTMRETADYIARRLELAGAPPYVGALFPEDTVRAVYDYSSGVPRLINSICDQALAAAHALQIHSIPVSIINDVAFRFRLERAPKPVRTESLSETSNQPKEGVFDKDDPSAAADSLSPAEFPDPKTFSAATEPNHSFRSLSEQLQTSRVPQLPSLTGGKDAEQSFVAGSPVQFVQENSRIHLQPQTPYDSPEGGRNSEPPVVVADLREQLLDSFETNFRNTWFDTEQAIVSDEALKSTLLIKVVRELSSGMNAVGACIAVPDKQGMRCIANNGDAPPVGSLLQPHAKLTRDCIETGKAVVCEDIEAHWSIERSDSNALRLRSAVAVPIHAKGLNVGVIEVFSSEPSAFCETHVADLQQVVNLLADDPAVLQLVNSQTFGSVSGSVEAPIHGTSWKSQNPPGRLIFSADQRVRPQQRVPDGPELFHNTQDLGGKRRQEFAYDRAERRASRLWLAGAGAVLFLLYLILVVPFRSSHSGVPHSPSGPAKMDNSARHSVVVPSSKKSGGGQKQKCPHHPGGQLGPQHPCSDLRKEGHLLG